MVVFDRRNPTFFISSHSIVKDPALQIKSCAGARITASLMSLIQIQLVQRKSFQKLVDCALCVFPKNTRAIRQAA